MNATKSGYIFTIVAITLFSIQDGISKHLAGAYPPFLVAMIRYWTFALFAIGSLSYVPRVTPARLRTLNPES